MTKNLIDIKKELREKAEEELPVWFSVYTSTMRADIFKFIDVVADTVAQGMKEACELEELQPQETCNHHNCSSNQMCRKWEDERAVFNAAIRQMHEKVEAFMKQKE